MPIKKTPRFFRPLKMDRYLLTEVLGPFIGASVFFVFILLMFQMLRLAEFFIVHGVALGTLGKMTLLMCLSFLPMALPAAFLIAVLTAFNRLSADSELVAMKANGFGMLRLSAPLLAFASLIVALSLGLNLEWVPWGERTSKQLLIKVGNTKAVSKIKEGTFTSDFFDLLIFADKVDTRTNQLKRVFIFDEREPGNPLAVVARTGEIQPVRTGSELGAAAILKLYDGSIHSNDMRENTYQKIGFGEYRLYLKVDEGAADGTTKPQMIPYSQLLKLIEQHPPTTFHGREFRGEFWRRYAIALAPLIFVFLGMGFGTVRTRAVKAGPVVIALVVMVLYWGIQTWATFRLQRGELPPALALQLPNTAMLILAIIGYRKATW